MEVYIFMVLFVIIIGILLYNLPMRKGQRNGILCCFALLIMLFFAAFRADSVGADTIQYLTALHNCRVPDFSFSIDYTVEPFKFEPGYLMFNRFWGFIGVNDTLFLAIVGLIIYVPTLIFFYKYSSNVMLSLVMYMCLQFYGLSISAIRQMIAISIILAIIPMIWERKWIKWCIGIVAAMTFHVTAIIMLPMYWLNKIKINSIILFAFFVVEILSFLAGNYFLSILSLFPQMYDSFLTHVQTASFKIGDLLLLLVINALLVFIAFKREEISRNGIISLSIYSLMCSALVIVLSLFTGNILKRLNMYYFMFITLLAPFEIDRNFKGLNRIIIMTLMCLGLIGYLMVFLSNLDNSMRLTPYNFS